MEFWESALLEHDRKVGQIQTKQVSFLRGVAPLQ